MDWERVQNQRIAFLIGQGARLHPRQYPHLSAGQRYRLQALTAWQQGQLATALEWWSKQAAETTRVTLGL